MAAARQLNENEESLVGVYQARHDCWTSLFILNADGTFCGGGEMPNGTWFYENGQLMIHWYCWPPCSLQPLGQRDFCGEIKLRWVSTKTPEPVRKFASEPNTHFQYVPFQHRTDGLRRKVLLVSFYMANISKEVLACQGEVFAEFDLPLQQTLFSGAHSEAIDNVVRSETLYDYVITFDVDAVPLTRQCVSKLLFNVDHYQALVGVAQQSNHINSDHPYAGPCCCAFSMESYKKLGSPSFQASVRGDVGEELSWRCQELGLPVCLLWPTQVEEPRWNLGRGMRFGLGTTYENEVYHAYESRLSSQRFISRCKSLLDQVKRK